MKKVCIVLFVVALVFTTPAIVTAQFLEGGADANSTLEGGSDSNPVLEGGADANPKRTFNTPSVQNPLAVGTIQGLFQAIIDIVMVFAVPIIVFFIVYAGFLYVTARGNVDQIGKAHKALLYALIGGLLILGANVLIDVVAGTVNAVQ